MSGGQGRRRAKGGDSALLPCARAAQQHETARTMRSRQDQEHRGQWERRETGRDFGMIRENRSLLSPSSTSRSPPPLLKVRRARACGKGIAVGRKKPRQTPGDTEARSTGNERIQILELRDDGGSASGNEEARGSWRRVSSARALRCSGRPMRLRRLTPCKTTGRPLSPQSIPSTLARPYSLPCTPSHSDRACPHLPFAHRCFVGADKILVAPSTDADRATER